MPPLPERFPPPKRLHWARPEGSSLKLVYLYWGVRLYGRAPSLCIRKGLWTYQVIRKGSPVLVLACGEVPLRPRDVVVIHPACAYGLRDEGARTSEVLGWQWEGAPHRAECTPPPRGFIRWGVDAAEVRELEGIHAACRVEALEQDACTPVALESQRMSLDVVLARSRGRGPRGGRAEDRLDLAISWMRQNLALEDPVHSLCDYLQISAPRLRRLFLRGAKGSPAVHYQRLKMECAAELLRDKSVKEVAYQLGYRYPNDFSKAYTKFYGRSPRTQRGRDRS